MTKNMTIDIHGRLFDLAYPQVMGILNVTPDSFYAGSRSTEAQAIAARVGQMLAEGASIIDIGAVSTRPGAADVSADEEKRRLETALHVVRTQFPDTVVSVDTYRADVASWCIDHFRADIINDVSGGADPPMYNVIARARVPYILMHGATGLGAATVPASASEELLPGMLRFFADRIQRLHEEGVADVIIDPGFGFGKTVQDNFEVLRHLSDFHLFEKPLLVGISRKSMIYRALGITPDEALNGTTVLNTLALKAGAHILRVHDVKPAVEAVRLVHFPLNPNPQS